MIEFYNVKLNFSDRPIFEEVTFRILKGEFAYLTGPSGAGKSTILRLIYMDLFPSQGMVIVENFSSAKIREKDIPYLRRKVGVVFQDFKLLPDRTVFENVAFSLRVTGAKSKEIKRKVMRALAEVNLGHKRNQYPENLSGGEQQRVAIARAIINDPFIIVADEPTGNLDNRASEEIMDLLTDINQRGTAILMATHDSALTQKYPHKTLFINEGVLTEK
jgi:cell division transport system ATP-binding protein